MSKHEQMAELRAAAQRLMAPACEPGTNLVWGEGNLDSALVIVGEAPGGREDRLGRPFAGPAGAFLEGELEAAGIIREQVYVTNVLKCRPVRSDCGRTRNRPPWAREIRAWRDTLIREIQIVSPVLILCLGATAASVLIQPRFALKTERGKWFDGPLSTRVLAAFHPAYVRCTAHGAVTRAQFRGDLRTVARELNKRSR